MTVNEDALRQGLVTVMREMDTSGLNHGTAGNASVRIGEHFLVTPSGIPAPQLAPEHMVKIDRSGAYSGDVRPTSEWRMHAGLLAGRPDINAVVHCHSQYATTLACANKPIPPLHYMTAVSGGPDIRVAPYALSVRTNLRKSSLKRFKGAAPALWPIMGKLLWGAHCPKRC